MNAERLLEFVTEILAVERELGVQGKLGEFSSALGTLTAQPQQPIHQKAVSDKLAALSKALGSLQERLTPAQWQFLNDVGAIDYFSKYGSGVMDEQLKNNVMTPSVANDFVKTWMTRRDEYLQKFEQLRTNLTFVGIKTSSIEPGEAEIGFQIPRPIFNNQLGGLSVELKVIDRVVGFVSEAVTGRKLSVEIRSISSSDPTVFVTTVVPVVIALGALVSWLLDCYERTLRIRKLKREAKETGHPEAGLKIFDKQISDQVEQHVDTKIAELMESYKSSKGDGRRSELENGLRWTIDSLFARIERGMTVELRFIPPPRSKVETSGEEDGTIDQQAQFDQLSKIQQSLEFPKLEGEPIHQLPPPEPPEKASA